MSIRLFNSTHRFFDNRSSFQKKNDFFKMVYKDVYHLACRTIQKRLTLDSDDESKYFPLSHEKVKWEKNEGLILMIHGLFGHPIHWLGHIELFKKYPAALEIKAPAVVKSGNCSMEEASLPIVDLLYDYRADFPDNPICILSNSNGGRIANDVDIKLRKEKVDLMISTIAGACLGTTNMDLVKKTPFISFFDEHLIEELSYQSFHSQKMIEALREKVQVGSRTYRFYASTEDYIVPYTSSLPFIDQNETHFLLHGEGHESIIHKVREEQVESCMKFILNNSSSNRLQRE